ncbi:MAG: hypothetical protein IM638_13340 [Bacteroidetes bacterium]|nr:hypothetical protein [Bacteroidota bacterium]
MSGFFVALLFCRIFWPIDALFESIPEGAWRKRNEGRSKKDAQSLIRKNPANLSGSYPANSLM